MYMVIIVLLSMIKWDMGKGTCRVEHISHPELGRDINHVILAKLSTIAIFIVQALRSSSLKIVDKDYAHDYYCSTGRL